MITGQNVRQHYSLLSIVLCVYFGLGLFVALSMPPWGLYDEQQHLDYIIRIEQGLPLPQTNDLLLSEIADEIYSADRWGRFGWKGPGSPDPGTWGLEGTSYEAHQPPAYYLLAAFFLKPLGALSVVSKLFLLRIFSVLLSTLTVFFYARALCAFVKPRDTNIMYLGLLVLVTLPSRVLAVTHVTNDVLAELLCAAMLLVATKMFLGTASLHATVRLAILSGIAIFTKVTVILWAIPLFFLYLTTPRDRSLAVHGAVFVACWVGLVLLFSSVLMDRLSPDQASLELFESFGFFGSNVALSFIFTFTTLATSSFSIHVLGMGYGEALLWSVPCLVVLGFTGFRATVAAFREYGLQGRERLWRNALVITVVGVGLAQQISVFVGLLPFADARLLLPYLGPLILIISYHSLQGLAPRVVRLSLILLIPLVNVVILFRVLTHFYGDMPWRVGAAFVQEKPDWVWGALIVVSVILGAALLLLAVRSRAAVRDMLVK